MSLGYRQLIAWLVDFASRLFDYLLSKVEPVGGTGVVLVDGNRPSPPPRSGSAGWLVS